jgi:hypothetical protein
MNLDTACTVADAVLYEGYVLYPYRASAQKNRSRWQFGVVMPAGYAALDPSESAVSQTECLLEYTDHTVIEVLLRFLQVQQRSVQAWQRQARSFATVETLTVAGTPIAAWDEAVERKLVLRLHIGELLGSGHRQSAHGEPGHVEPGRIEPPPVEPGRIEPLHVNGGEEIELVRDEHGAVIGRLVRQRQALDGEVAVSAQPLPGPWQAVRLRVRVANHTAPQPVPQRREQALPAALVAVHTIIGVEDGTFLSMLDPPEWARGAVEECQNIGTWPVLAGQGGAPDAVLSSPIILYDYPEVAPESPGDLYDATEIDEILTLRTLTLTDEEKREARATDPRAAQLIDRVDALDPQAIERLHGTVRYLRPVGDEPRPDTPWWDPDAEAAVSPHTDTVTVGAAVLRCGSTVRLRPGTRRADAQDMFLAGRLATIEAVLHDVDDRPYLAVTLADDASADLQRAHGRFLYFTPDEVEPASPPEGEAGS